MKPSITSRPATHSLPAPLAWALEFLPEYFSDPPGAMHVELMGDLERADRRLMARVAPRGHAKSTCVALAYPLWCVCERRRRNIVIITHERSLAVQFVRDIRTELENNPRILERYGALLESDVRRERQAARLRRSDTALLTRTGVSVLARSVGGALRGTRVGPHRPDLIICDDIERDDLVQSRSQRRKLERWLLRAVIPALAPGGRLVVVGSILHHDGLLANLADASRFGRWDYRVYRALEARRAAGGQWHYEALWPARWPVARLLEERERIGSLAFEQEYQANPIDESVRVFRAERLHRYDPAELENKELLTLMAVDPATGREAGDYFALWVGSVDVHTGIIYTRELRLERIGFTEQIGRIVESFERWRPARIAIEINAYQVALRDALLEHGRRTGTYLPVEGFCQTRHKHARVLAIVPLFEDGTFRLPRWLPAEVESQLLAYPQGGHDDAADVCAMGVELVRRVRGALRAETAVQARRGSPDRHGW